MGGRRVTGNRKTCLTAGNSAAGNVRPAGIHHYAIGAPGSLHVSAIEVERGIVDGDFTGLRAIGIERRCAVQHVIVGCSGAINRQDLTRIQHQGMRHFTDQ
ncbi:hypothetical protein D3C84_480280 [compost metagenome]